MAENAVPTEMPDPAGMTDDELRAQLEERQRAANMIRDQIAADQARVTDRGRHWRARATTARAGFKAQVKELRRELERRRQDANFSRRAEAHATRDRFLAEAKARRELNLAMRFQAAAKRMLPRDTYHEILAIAQAEATPPAPSASAAPPPAG